MHRKELLTELTMKGFQGPRIVTGSQTKPRTSAQTPGFYDGDVNDEDDDDDEEDEDYGNF